MHIQLALCTFSSKLRKIRLAPDLPQLHYNESPVVSGICTANVPQVLYKLQTCFENGKRFIGN